MNTGQRFYHGGKGGLKIGDLLLPSPPHVTDGCPVCVARREGRPYSIGEYRRWLEQVNHPNKDKIFKIFAGASDFELIDPPSEKDAVYITTDLDYATWYAARSGHGDLYLVEPCSEPILTEEDNFMSFTVESARIVYILRRNVYLTRTERRRIDRRWEKADRKNARGVRGGL